MTMYDDEDLLFHGDPSNPETDWRDDFPDRRIWDLWVEFGWGDAPWTAGCWFRAGYSPLEADALSTQGYPPPGTIDAAGRGFEYPEPSLS